MPDKQTGGSPSSFPSVSIIIPTYNRASILKVTLACLLSLDYPTSYEVIIVDDGSVDTTREMVLSFIGQYPDVFRLISLPRTMGPAFARNIGIFYAKYDIVVLLDDDCVVNKKWLKKLISTMVQEKAHVVCASRAVTHACCFQKHVLQKAGLLDIRFRVGNNCYPYREDADLEFRLQDSGYEIVFLKQAEEMVRHIHPTPKGFSDKVKLILKSLAIRQLDVLLFKKHPEKTKELLNIKYRSVSIFLDIKKAAGEIGRPTKFSFKKLLNISSCSFLDRFMLHMLAFLYTILIKIVRFLGSLRFGVFLI